MAQNDILQVSQVSVVDGEPTANVWHVQQTTSGTPDLNDLYADVDALWNSIVNPVWANRSSDEAKVECLKIQRISPTRDPAQIFPHAVTGLVLQAAMPAINSAVHSWYTAIVTGRGRGRKWWSGVPRSHVEDNNLNAAALALNRTFADVFIPPWVGTDTFQCGIWSPTGSSFSPVVGILVRPPLRNVRSRKPNLCI